MRIGLLADIHGNADALQAVLVSAREQEVDQLLIAGDFVGYYYEPDRVLELLSEWKWTAVAGNHESLLRQWRRKENREQLKQKYGSGLAQAVSRLDAAEIERLLTLPEQWHGRIAGRRVLLCHGSTWNADEYVYPDDRSGRLARMADGGEDLVVFGHTHYPALMTSGSTIVVNPGSVGQPRDRNPDAAWALWDAESHVVTLKRIPYDAGRVLEQCRTFDPSIHYLSEVLTRR
jgi:putative phosphoesterase